MYVPYSDHVPDQPKTKHRTIRVPDERWAAAEKAAVALDSDRSVLINAYLAWLSREPGAKALKRPPAEPESD
jgi:hypothetical protein